MGRSAFESLLRRSGLEGQRGMFEGCVSRWGGTKRSFELPAAPGSSIRSAERGRPVLCCLLHQVSPYIPPREAVLSCLTSCAIWVHHAGSVCVRVGVRVRARTRSKPADLSRAPIPVVSSRKNKILETSPLKNHEWCLVGYCLFREVYTCPRRDAALAGENRNTRLKEYGPNSIDEGHWRGTISATCPPRFVSAPPRRTLTLQGISFNDHYARGVLCVGIPFPNWGNAQVQAKMCYNSWKRLGEQPTDGDRGGGGRRSWPAICDDGDHGYGVITRTTGGGGGGGGTVPVPVPVPAAPRGVAIGPMGTPREHEAAAAAALREEEAAAARQAADETAREAAVIAKAAALKAGQQLLSGNDWYLQEAFRALNQVRRAGWACRNGR